MNCKTLCAKSAVLLRPSDFLTGGCNSGRTDSFLYVTSHTARGEARFCHREKTAFFELSFLRAPEPAGAP